MLTITVFSKLKYIIFENVFNILFAYVSIKFYLDCLGELDTFVFLMYGSSVRIRI